MSEKWRVAALRARLFLAEFSTPRALFLKQFPIVAIAEVKEITPPKVRGRSGAAAT